VLHTVEQGTQPHSGSGPQRQPGGCYTCGGTRRWRSIYGALLCATCHPPADAALVTWEGEV
jgi:hypothetical protein